MLLSALLSGKAAAAVVVAGTVTLGGGTAVAFAGGLPAGLQQVAHDTIGAPPASAGNAAPATLKAAGQSQAGSSTDSSSSSGSTPTASPSPKGPDATGPAAFGLCTAYAHGGLAQSSVAYQNLAAAASTWAGTNDQSATGAADQITAYCGTIAHPGASTRPTDQPSVSTPGKPSSVPVGKPSFAPVGPPSAHPSGQPSFAPVGPPVRQ
jgi:hypothetical protein